MLQPSETDFLAPHPMREPRVLYRSVSLPELADIHRTGRVMGGGNTFSGDARPYVFFGDVLNTRLIGQGECVRRQAHFALQNRPLSRRLKTLEESIATKAREIAALMDADGVGYDAALIGNFELGDGRRHFRDAAFSAAPNGRERYRRLFREMGLDCWEQAMLQMEYTRSFDRALRQIGEWITKSPYSSAVLVTRPLTGGFHYSDEFGGSLHGGPEFGFTPGQVTLRDISEIRLIKDWQQIGICTPEALGDVLTDADPSIFASAQSERHCGHRSAIRLMLQPENRRSDAL